MCFNRIVALQVWPRSWRTFVARVNILYHDCDTEVQTVLTILADSDTSTLLTVFWSCTWWIQVVQGNADKVTTMLANKYTRCINSYDKMDKSQRRWCINIHWPCYNIYHSVPWCATKTCDISRRVCHLTPFGGYSQMRPKCCDLLEYHPSVDRLVLQGFTNLLGNWHYRG